MTSYAFFLYQRGFEPNPPADRRSRFLHQYENFSPPLKAQGIPGFTMVTETLLDLNFEEREQLAERLRQMSKERPGDPELFKLDTAVFR